MKELAILTTILISLSFVATENVSAITENIILDKYNISFNMDTKAALNKTYIEPYRSKTDEGIGNTNYVCALTNTSDKILSVGISKYDTDRASVLANKGSDRLWLNGLTWEGNTNITITPSVTGWMASTWFNNKTMIAFIGSYPEKEFDRIRETLSVKENGKEIYKK